jgi:hypothetical protein
LIIRLRDHLGLFIPVLEIMLIIIDLVFALLFIGLKFPFLLLWFLLLRERHLILFVLQSLDEFLVQCERL